MKGINLVLLLCMIMLTAVFSPINAHAIGMAKVTVKAVDEEGKPVEGADVQFCFFGGCLKKDVITGKTDSDGGYSVSGYSSDGVTGGTVLKNGYYNSIFHRDFHATALGMWQPWNKEIKVILRPKIKPVPMYVRNKWVTIPALDKEIGFDLMKFDWVIPYGQGVVSDFIFLVKSRYNNVDDFDTTLAMIFSNKYDGIQEITTDRGGDFGVGSIMKLPRYAPETGYQPKLVKRRISGPSLNILTDNITNYFFRVRSEVDEKGNLVRAMYGKITDDVKIDPRGSLTGEIRFIYYLNPDYTHNLEYDTDANLFSPLPEGETIIGDP